MSALCGLLNPPTFNLKPYCDPGYLQFYGLYLLIIRGSYYYCRYIYSQVNPGGSGS